MAVGALEGRIVKVLWMPEFLASGVELKKLRPLSLREDDVARAAVIRFDGAFSIFGFVVAVMATETARPVSMSNIVRIDAPTGLHFREVIVDENLLDKRDGPTNAGVIGILIGEECSDALSSVRGGLVRAAEGVNGVGFDVRQCAVQMAKGDGEVDGVTGRSVAMGRPVMAIHAVHPADFVLADVVGEP